MVVKLEVKKETLPVTSSANLTLGNKTYIEDMEIHSLKGTCAHLTSRWRQVLRGSTDK